MCCCSSLILQTYRISIDGTGVRDYIHVVDLAEGHVAAIEQLTKGAHVYNLGTGKGTSVLEFVQAFEEANNWTDVNKLDSN